MLQELPKRLTIEFSKLNDGEIKINGYKHAMVQIIAFSIAQNICITITNTPLVDDTYILKQIIETNGGRLDILDNNIHVDPREMNSSVIDPTLSKKIHGSLYLIPAFAVRFKKFSFSEAGGCQIGDLKEKGSRPISHILHTMELFGIKSEIIEGTIQGKQEEKKELVEIDIMQFSQTPSISSGPHISGATKTAILCSLLTSETRILNPYLKTDVQDLLRFLTLLGHKITISDKYIEIIPVKINFQEGLQFCLSDCISEIMTYIALAILADINLKLKIKNLEQIKKGLKKELFFLEKMGINFKLTTNYIYIYKSNNIKSINIEVFNNSIQSDHHPFFTLIALKADQSSTITEFVWKARFAYAKELIKLDAVLQIKNNVLKINPSLLKSCEEPLNATDTRAAAVLTLAALTVEGKTIINNIHHMHRGYANLLESIQSLGGNLKEEDIYLEELIITK